VNTFFGATFIERGILYATFNVAWRICENTGKSREIQIRKKMSTSFSALRSQKIKNTDY